MKIRIMRRLAMIGLFAMCLVPTIAQTTHETATTPTAKVKQVIIEHADDIIYDAAIAPDAKRAIGNVLIVHDSITMTCDSTYMYESSNSLEAFGAVHITRPDSSTVDGEFARYQGNIRFAEIWENVVLQDSNTIMKTPHLFYDMNANIAYYTDSADIVNDSNTLFSRRGYYHRNINTFYFKKDVELHSPDYNIYADSLKYNVETKIAEFLGPTHIIDAEKEKDTVYCERGWYNTNDTVALFRQNAWIKSGSTTVNADTLYYERQAGRGRALSHIQIVDTANDVILKGDIGDFNNNTEVAWITRRAEMEMLGKDDTLFMHADTLRSVKDTDDFKIMKAYHHVKFFSRDMQGMCDSLSIMMRDSVIRMYQTPVLWAQENQMTADYIEIETENKHPKQLNLLGKGFMCNELDSVGFNQLSGSKVYGYFKPGTNELHLIDVDNNAQAVYYLQEDDGFINGANKTASNTMRIWMQGKAVDEIGAYQNVTGDEIPVNEFNASELTLPGFQWWEKHKPLVRSDIFHWGARADESGDSTTNTQKIRVPDSLRFRIQRLLDGVDAHAGIAIRGSENKDTMTFRGNELFPMADIYKYHVALATLRLVDFGTLRLNQPVVFTKEELRPYPESPLRKEYPGGSKELKLSDILTYMVSQNDDNACELILKLLKGTKRVEQIVKSMGVSPVTIAVSPQEMLADSSLRTKNTTTPYAALQALDILRRNDILSASSRATLWRMMGVASTGFDKIRAKLSRTAVIGHKSGSIPRNAGDLCLADNDIAIAELDAERYFELAVFVKNSQENNKIINDLIAEIAVEVWNYYK